MTPSIESLTFRYRVVSPSALVKNAKGTKPGLAGNGVGHRRISYPFGARGLFYRRLRERG